jgi:hypothetical protein
MSKSTKEIRPVLDPLVKDQKEVSESHGRMGAEFKKGGRGYQAINCSIRSSNVWK